MFGMCDFEYRYASGGSGRVRADKLWRAAELAREDAGDLLGLGVLLRCTTQSQCRHPAGWTLVGLPGQDARTSLTGSAQGRPPETDADKSGASAAAGLSATRQAQREDDFAESTDEDVVLRTVGVVFDGGLGAQGVPPESWYEHALGALGSELRAGADGSIAVLREEEWEYPAAEDVLAVVDETAALLVEVGAFGGDFFTALTLAERGALREATGAIAHVSQASSRLRRN